MVIISCISCVDVDMKGTGMSCDFPTLLIKTPISSSSAMELCNFSKDSGEVQVLKSKARVLTLILGLEARICSARSSSLDWVRDMRRRLKGVRDS